MSTKLFTQHTWIYFLSVLLFMTVLGTTACGASEPVNPDHSPQKTASEADAGQVVAEEPMIEAAAEEETIGMEQEAAETENPAPDSSVSPISNRPNAYNRLIIKNAEVEMLVADTDMAIHTSMNIVAEFGGYVVSNRTWFKDEFKYATVSIGVPSENFEAMLNRLKALALVVTNETVSGQDVTDEYVDLKSRLVNLEATAARIRDSKARRW